MGTGTIVRLTRLDGTLCTPDESRLRGVLAEWFVRQGLSLDRVERDVIARLDHRVVTAVRAHARLETFTRELAAWRKIAPVVRSRSRAGAPIEELAELNKSRPSSLPPDAQGGYTLARRQLIDELQAAWPSHHRRDALQSAVFAAVTDAIRVQFAAQRQRGRLVERAGDDEIDRQAAAFIRFHYPFLSARRTRHRLRRRSGPIKRHPRIGLA